MAGKFNTNTDFNAEEMESKLLGGSLAQVKEELNKENATHVEKIDKQERADQEKANKDYLQSMLFGRKFENYRENGEKIGTRAVKLLDNDDLALLAELSENSQRFKISFCINNLISEFVGKHREEIKHIIEVSKEYNSVNGGKR